MTSTRVPRALLLILAFTAPVVLACAGGPSSREEAPPPPPPAKDWATLFPTRAAFPALTRGVAPGMTRLQATQADPSFTDATLWTTPEFPELLFRPEIDPVSDSVRALVVDLPAAEAETKLTAAWGPAALVKGRADSGTRAVWWDPAAGRRAELMPAVGATRALRLTAYVPVDRLLGAGPDWAFLDAGPIFGKTVDEIALAYGDRLRVAARGGAEQVYLKIAGTRPSPDLGHEFWLSLPMTEYSPAPTRARLGFTRDGRCNSFRLALDYAGQVPARDAIVALLTQRFGGTATTVEEEGRTYTLYSSRPRVTGEVDEVAEQYLVKADMGGMTDHRPRAGAQRPRPRPGEGGGQLGGRPRTGGLKPKDR